jgi:hypothetical protein
VLIRGMHRVKKVQAQRSLKDGMRASYLIPFQSEVSDLASWCKNVAVSCHFQTGQYRSTDLQPYFVCHVKPFGSPALFHQVNINPNSSMKIQPSE